MITNISTKRRLNKTVTVSMKPSHKGARLKVTVHGGEFDGKSKFITVTDAIGVSPKSTINPRAVGREVLRRLAS